MSFESAFSAGSSPDWFNSLPTSVRSYLHTYSGFGGLATAAGAVKEVTQSAGSEAIAGGTSTGIRPLGATKSSGAPAATATGGSSDMSTMTSMGPSSSAASASSASTLSEAQISVTQTSSSSTASSSSSQGGAARPTRAIAAGLVGAMGILGVAVAL